MTDFMENHDIYFNKRSRWLIFLFKFIKSKKKIWGGILAFQSQNKLKLYESDLPLSCSLPVGGGICCDRKITFV